MAEKTFRDGRAVTIGEISRATGIHRATLSKIMNERGYNTGSENIDRLCRFFGCSVSDVMTYLPDEQV